MSKILIWPMTLQKTILVKMYEVKLKLLNVSEGVTITDSQQQQIRQEIKEMEQMCGLNMNKDTGMQDVFDRCLMTC